MIESIEKLGDYEDLWFANVRIVCRDEDGRRWYMVYLPTELVARCADTPSEVWSIVNDRAETNSVLMTKTKMYQALCRAQDRSRCLPPDSDLVLVEESGTLIMTMDLAYHRNLPDLFWAAESACNRLIDEVIERRSYAK